MKMLRELLDERKKVVHVKRDCVDFIDQLIEDVKEDRSEMTEEIGLDLIVAVLFASSDTTSSVMTIIVRFLTDNPKALLELIVSN
jgi:cytochrome P450 family 26 subfamily A